MPLSTIFQLLWFHFLLLLSIFMDWQQLRGLLTFIHLGFWYFSCYLCLSLCTTFCSLIESTKPQKICIQLIIQPFLFFFPLSPCPCLLHSTILPKPLFCFYLLSILMFVLPQPFFFLLFLLSIFMYIDMLLTHPFFFFFPFPASPSVAADCWLVILQALDKLLILETLSEDIWRVILASTKCLHLVQYRLLKFRFKWYSFIEINTC